MVVSDFVPAVSYQATGKVNSYATGSTKWLKVLALANSCIRDWQDEPGVDWNSLYTPDYSIGTVTATNSFTVPAVIRKISNQEGDVIRIIHADGVAFTDYSVIPNDRQKDFADGTRTFQNNFIIQVGPTIKFNRAFNSTDPQFGGTITIPGYLYASTLVNDSDVVPVDIPNWLVYATAAAFDSTDVTRQQLVPRLETKANEIMQVMISNNDGQVTDMYRPWRPGGPSLTGNGFIGDW